MRKIFPLLLAWIHPSWCFYGLIFGLIAGVVIGTFTQRVWIAHWLVLICLAGSFLITLLYPCGVTVLLAFSIGIVFGNLRLLPEFSGQELWRGIIGQEITITGIIADDPNLAQGTYKFKLKQLQIDQEKIPGEIYVQLPQNGSSLERSDEITISGKAGAGFGTYTASFYRPRLEKIRRASSGDIFVRIKNWFSEIVRRFIPAPAAELGLSYLMGLKTIPEDLSEILRIVGMTHVVVASGTHLGILVGAAKKLFGRISKFAGLLTALLLIAAFVMVVGFTPSMTRAALVASLSIIVGYFGRSFSPLRLLGLVAMLTLMLEPTYLINLGWQLSFASFFGILLVAPKLQKLLYGGKKPPWLANMLITSFATTIICLPVLVYNFGTLSLLSFVANLIILPTLPYVMLLVLLTGIFSFLPWLACAIGQLAQILLELHINVVSFLSQQKTFVLELTSGDVRIFLVYLPIMLLILGMIWLTRDYSRNHAPLDSS